jgi:hypothetical protein
MDALWNSPAIDVGRGSAYKEVAEAMIASLDESQRAGDFRVRDFHGSVIEHDA